MEGHQTCDAFEGYPLDQRVEQLAAHNLGAILHLDQVVQRESHSKHGIIPKGVTAAIQPRVRTTPRSASMHLHGHTQKSAHIHERARTQRVRVPAAGTSWTRATGYRRRRRGVCWGHDRCPERRGRQRPRRPSQDCTTRLAC
eukprot:3439315-Prymnesium_polylepis.1